MDSSETSAETAAVCVFSAKTWTLESKQGPTTREHRMSESSHVDAGDTVLGRRPKYGKIET